MSSEGSDSPLHQSEPYTEAKTTTEPHHAPIEKDTKSTSGGKNDSSSHQSKEQHPAVPQT